MPEIKPEGAPSHPYNNPEQYKVLSQNRGFAEKFWWYLKDPEASYEDSLFPPQSRAKLNPEKVVELFSQYKNDLFKKRESGEIFPCRETQLERFSIYDVYLYGLWQTNRSAYYGIPPSERSNYDVCKTAQKEQVLALAEAAMHLAGHRPSNAAIMEYPL